MGRTLVTTAVLLLLLVLVAPAGGDEPDPNLMGWWTFDGDALDSSGHERHGTLQGAPQFVPGVYDDALECFGGPDYVTIDGYKGVLGTHAFSIAAWIKTTNTAIEQIVHWGAHVNGQRVEFRINNNRLRISHGSGNVQGDTELTDGEWYHVAVTVVDNATVSSGDVTFYVDGQDDTRASSDPDAWNLVANSTLDVTIGWRPTQQDRPFVGTLDEVRIYDKALTAAEVQALAMRPKAYDPTPADGTLGVTSPLLSWQPRQTAIFHDVYLGTQADLGPEDLVQAHLPTTLYWHAAGLEPGTTYYWRIDEIDPDGTVYTGDVWTFTFSPLEAWHPDPVDGEPYANPGVTLTWLKGLSGVSHDVYFGADETEVAEGTGDTFKGNQFAMSFVTGELEMDTTYYWRVDEVDAADNRTTGNVWSFKTLPVIPMTDPDLIGWWTFDAGIGSRAVDWSGHGHHGALRQGAEWMVPGWIGRAGIDLAASGYVAIENLSYSDPNRTEVTVSAWIRTDNSDIQAIASFDRSEYWRLEINGYADDGEVGWSVATSTGTIDLASLTRVDDGQWHHVAGVFDNGTLSIYIDGRLDVWATGGPIFGSGNIRYGFMGSQSEATSFDGDRSGSPSLFDGSLDDVRLYHRALSAEDILEVMRGDPLLAWDLQPSNGKILDIRELTLLGWKAGDMAAQHDVYFGTDADAVQSADTSDATGVYRGRQAGTTYVPPEGFAWGQVYYWRIDEVNADGTITKGGVRTFTVVDYLIVDDFESYNDDIDAGTTIFQTWIDGWDNGTGSTVGNLTSPFAEQTLVYSGQQAMPLDYNNIISPFYSEAERTWTAPQDWRFNDVNTLIVHFRGQPVDFIETGPGSFTMSGAGTDIWDVADEFRFAYKRLDGDGTIIARVDSIENTHNWAKGGVMIRESLEPWSRHAMVVVSLANGVAFQRRLANNGTSTGTTEAGIVAPHWVKLTRSGNELTAQHSADGVTWVDVGDDPLASTDTVVMGGTIYIGLALTSHSPDNATTAAFSNVELTGGVSGQWQMAEIGVDHPGNSPDRFYIAVEDTGGSVAVVTHPDAGAVLTNEWQRWTVDLDTVVGVNLRSIKKMYIGVGDRDAPQPAGAGRMYIDDIRIMQGVPAEPNAVE